MLMYTSMLHHHHRRYETVCIEHVTCIGMCLWVCSLTQNLSSFYQGGGGGWDYQLCNSPISGHVFAVSGDITCCLLGFIPHGFLQSLQHYKELHGWELTVCGEEHWVHNFYLNLVHAATACAKIVMLWFCTSMVLFNKLSLAWEDCSCNGGV